MKNELITIREKLIEDIDDFEIEFKEFHKKEKREARRRGERDGRDGKPAPDSTSYNAVEREIFQSYAAKISELARDFQGSLKSIDKDYIHTISQKMHDLGNAEIKDEINKLQQQREEELRRSEKNYHEQIEEKQNDPDLTALRERYDELDDNYQEMAETLGRRDTNEFFKWPKGAYWGVIVLIGLFEVAANYGMFLNFEEPPLTTWIWAIAFGVVISFVGHFNGLLLCRARESRNYLIAGLLLLVVVCAGLWAVARYRMEVLPDDVPGKWMSEWVFIFISLILYSVACFLSFMSHDSNPEFEKTIKKREAGRKKLEEKKKATHGEIHHLKEQLRNEEKAIADKYQKEMDKVLGELNAFKLLYHDAVALYDEILASLKNMEDYIIRSYKETIQTYRSSNAKRRKKPEPDYWNAEPNDLPTKFEQMKEIDESTINEGLWTIQQK